MLKKTSFHKIGLLIVGAVVLFLGCNNGAKKSTKPAKWMPYNEQTSLEEDQLRAKMRVEKREGKTTTSTDSGQVSYISEVVLYNRFGQPTLTQVMGEDGKITKETRADYRDSLLVRQAINESTGYSSAMEIYYNDKKQKVGEKLFQRGDSTMRRRYTLNEAGYEIEVNLTRFRDSTKYKLVTERDNVGRPVKVTEFYGAQTDWIEDYEMTDTLWRIKRTGPDSVAQSDYEMHFDANGRLLKMINRDPDGKARVTVNYVNDENGRNLKESYFGAKNNLMQTLEFRYNEVGLLIERKLSSPIQPIPLTTIYSYTFRK